MMNYKLFIAVLAITFFASCNDDDEQVTTAKGFTVTIENIFEPKENFSSGPTEFIAPGGSSSFSFNAAKGHYLQLATMFVQSNDLFYAPDDSGIALYSADGVAHTGDITGDIDLWDAGTETNQAPGVGEDQAPRQSSGNVGETESGTVQLIENITDGHTYPADEEVIQILLEHDGGTQFTVTINNRSDASAIPTPFAPGVWAIHAAGLYPVFEENTTASVGLERIAEDGDNAIMTENLAMNSGLVSPFSPGAYVVGKENILFARATAASAALEALAEDGNPAGYENIFNTPVGSAAPAPIFPAQSYSFNFTAEEGDELSLATMLVQSNDWFIGLNSFPLFENGAPISGDITTSLSLYDAGTEVDEYSGAGHDQAPRQAAANTGASETDNVARESDPDDNVPSIPNMIRVTIEVN